MKKRSLMQRLLGAPYILWAAIFIIVPLIIVVYYSFTDSAGDLSPNPADDFPFDAAHDCEIIVCECAHFNASVLEGVFARCDTKAVVMNHYSPIRMQGLFELEKKRFPLPFTLATDNYEIEI